MAHFSILRLVACSGACWAQDPAVILRASDGLYLKFNTGVNIEIASSSYLNGPCTLQGSALTSGSNIDNHGNKDLWVRDSISPPCNRMLKLPLAPDTSLVSCIFHLYYSVSTSGSQESAIEFKAGSAYKAIDANLIKVGDTYLMNFGSPWNDTYQVKLNSAATKTSGEAS
ncbi:glycoside hydrolase, family 43 [Diplocarpon rosae]|nr:glycoside hydrolase, family 43 [Diplocarpon rosae]